MITVLDKGAAKFKFGKVKLTPPYLNIYISSDTDSCGTVSIHPMKCPIPDGYGDIVENDALITWKHMYRTGVLTLNTDGSTSLARSPRLLVGAIWAYGPRAHGPKAREPMGLRLLMGPGPMRAAPRAYAHS